MKYFVLPDGSLAIAVDNAVNAENLPLIECELTAPIHFCTAVLEDDKYKLVVQEDWEQALKNAGRTYYIEQITRAVDNLILKQVQMVGFPDVTQAFVSAVVESPKQEASKTLVALISTMREMLAQYIEANDFSEQSDLEFKNALMALVQ